MTSDTIDDIMDATHRALCRHGYADLTMQDIADEWSKSKAALHYHFDGKRDLLVSFLEHLLADFEERIEDLEGETAADRLFALADELCTSPEDEPHREFGTALLEIKAQAPYRDEYRKRLVRFDELLQRRVATLVREGVDAGEIPADVDPDEVAAVFATVVNGALTRNVAFGVPLEESREILHNYVRREVLDAPGGGDE